MKHGSLFSGMGAADLAAQWMGWENVFHCENNKFCQKVLKYYWPDAEQFDDIKQSSFLKYRGQIDVLTGGFPCQPFSNAGEQKGGSDERFIFKEMLRAIREVKPTWVVAENVRAITSPKFKDVFNEICTSLESEGYEISSLLIPATAIGAYHERHRLWLIAYSECHRFQGEGQFRNEVGYKAIRDRETSWPELLFQGKSVSHLFSHDNGIPEGLADYTVSEYRKQSNQATGNAMMPQMIYEIFKTIEQYEQLDFNPSPYPY